MRLGYITTYSRRLNGFQIKLPSELSDILSKKNQGCNHILAMGVIFKGTLKTIHLFDKKIDKYTPISDNEETPYIDNLKLTFNSLYLTKEAKEFLNLEKRIILSGNTDNLTLWNPKVYDVFHSSDYAKQKEKQIQDSAFRMRVGKSKK